MFKNKQINEPMINADQTTASSTRWDYVVADDVAWNDTVNV